MMVVIEATLRDFRIITEKPLPNTANSPKKDKSLEKALYKNENEGEGVREEETART